MGPSAAGDRRGRQTQGVKDFFVALNLYDTSDSPTSPGATPNETIWRLISIGWSLLAALISAPGCVKGNEPQRE
jgi:hypothetical protein